MGDSSSRKAAVTREVIVLRPTALDKRLRRHFPAAGLQHTTLSFRHAYAHRACQAAKRPSELSPR